MRFQVENWTVFVVSEGLDSEALGLEVAVLDVQVGETEESGGGVEDDGLLELASQRSHSSETGHVVDVQFGDESDSRAVDAEGVSEDGRG